MPSEIICGVNAVLECLRAGRRRVHEILIAAGKKKPTVEAIVAEARARSVSVRESSRKEIQAISRIEKNQGVAARVDPFAYTPVEELMRRAIDDGGEGVLVVLDDILDPQNLGSLIRTAHVSGACGVILPKDRSASIGPAATRAAAGATEYLPIACVTNLVQTLNQLKKNTFWVVGAEGTSDQSLYDYDFAGHPHAIVVGAEGTGMRRLVRECCDTLLSIPMCGEVGSYNVSVAGAIFMAEARRQRWTKNTCKSHTFSGERA